MKIAIHNKERGFSSRWIKYCEKNNIEYKLVNTYDSDIVEQVKDFDAFMWDFDQNDYKAILFARQLLYSLEIAGKKVFPNFNTCWHFDDKVGQKYLLESINAPLVSSYVFYTKKEAKEWINKAAFPKVFKLRDGAGSANVKLAKTKRHTIKFVNKAFGKGFSQFERWNHIKDFYKKYRVGKETFRRLLACIKYSLLPNEFNRMHGREKGYVYFQDFIPDNSFDIRICVVGNKAFGLKRMVRDNDFRASGGGIIIYDKEQIDIRCVKIAFDVNEKLKSQSIAYDFVFDERNNPLIVEISYGYTADAYDKCEGYWDKDINFHEEENFDFCGWMVDNLIEPRKL